MTLGERIKKVRRELDLTQQKFADRLGVRQNTIALIESGKRNTSDQLLFGVCREFHVSETWLKTGAGEMFLSAPDSALEALAQEYGLSPGAYALMKRFLELSPENQQTFVDFAVKIAEDLTNGGFQPVIPQPEPAPQEIDIEREVEEYRRRLLLEKNQADTSSPSSGGGAETA